MAEETKSKKGGEPAAAAADKARAEEAERFTRELQEKIKDLEDFHEVAVERELRMQQMKEEIEKLKAKLGEK